MKVSENFNDMLLFLLISYILLIFSDLGLCVTEISHVKTVGKKIGVQKDDLRKRASSVIPLCLACIPVAILYHLVVIIRLFRVILKLSHCCDMPVMLPDAVAQQFKPQREFSG